MKLLIVLVLLLTLSSTIADVEYLHHIKEGIWNDIVPAIHVELVNKSGTENREALEKTKKKTFDVPTDVHSLIKFANWSAAKETK